jgi:hypothetical protein
MKRFEDFLAEIDSYKEDLNQQQNVPDKGLDNFNALSSQLVMQLRNISDPNIRTSLQPLVNNFYTSIERELQKHKTQKQPQAVGVQANLGQNNLSQNNTVQNNQTASKMNPMN